MQASNHVKSLLLVIIVLYLLNSNDLQGESNSQSLSPREEILIAHVKTSIEKAEKGISELDPIILEIQGMSSPIIRHFLNNVCSLEDASYLEIGCWKGSTLIAATYRNEATLQDVIAIDNWSEFNGPKEEFLYNINTYLPTLPLRFHEGDSFLVDKSQIFFWPINIYFYDGNHSFEAQKAAFTFYDSVLDDIFITFVDDWNWEEVRAGTFAAFKELGYEILYERAFATSDTGMMSSWWNGFYIAVIRKTYQPLNSDQNPPRRRRLRLWTIKVPIPLTYGTGQK
jgi:hypothetical protein